MRIFNPPHVTLPGIQLRQLERADLDAWYAYLRLPSVVEHTSWNLNAAEDLLPMFESLASDAAESIRRLAVMDVASNTLIGTVGFHSVSATNRSAEIAYDLSPSHWGKGIAKAICAAMTHWAFDANGWVRIQGVTLESNLRSAAVLRACGYRQEGCLRAYRMVRGVPGNFHVFSRLPSDPE
ncbi:GNAT family N-acetyltransferase [Pandoraea pulmonicola]|uniref:GNAT family N-acetyltransferase n=1 Tax=Pandoraea pulmonicola TaxID=93221 RepID=A0AAJ4Z9X1_PANPU|nr:GNAT family protein [Pandoraea pulmonicola]AJC21791.1 GNAT family N-acetyltransferase [Pandoraea pulmonicola]SUA89311.1 Putative ribosomal N-acetyltransferase YdaF [Pandoraea pulmonicola]